MSDVGFASPVNPLTKNGQLAQHGSDAALHVTFYYESVYQDFESQQLGRPIYKDVEHVHIMLPGGKTDVKRKVDHYGNPGLGIPPDPERFPRQWQAFKNKQEQAQSGMPLEEWPPITKNLIGDFKACRIHTVEQLAALHDGNAQSGMPLDWRKWRDKAVTWLENARENAPVLALQSENAQLKADMEALRAQIATIGIGSQPVSSQPKRRGRPPKQHQPTEGEAA